MCLTKYFIFFIILGSAFLSSEAVNNKCIWYGQCDKSDPSKIKNCFYDGAPKTLKDDKIIQTMKDVCPEYVDNVANSITTCCDGAQIKTLAENLSPARILFGGCPNCMKNFVRLFCALTCDPNQDNFLKVTQMVTSIILAVNYTINSNFYKGLYNSCSGVVMSSSNSFAVDTICATSHDNCNSKAFYAGLGDGNKNSPFGIAFVNDADSGMNQTMLPCDLDGGPNNAIACSCQDCPAACKPLPPPKPTVQPLYILGIDAWYFIVGVIVFIFIVVLISFCTYQMLFTTKFQRESSESEMSDQTPSKFDLYGAKLETWLITGFYNWGSLIARYPIVTIFIALLAAGNICLGILIYKITTDPTELWSGPNSYTRENKNYFDQHFGPFYRTQQIIIVPKNPVPISMNAEYPYNNRVTYGAAFNKTLLKLVGYLQNNITHMKVQNAAQDKTFTLNDICFKPLSPDNNNCLVTSVMQYFKNNVSDLDKEVDSPDGFFVEATYMSQILACIQDPTGVTNTSFKENCFGDYGGPAFPYLLFGGFKGKNNYSDSKALVFTFLVNNVLNQESEQLKLAFEWEKEYLNVVQKFAENNPDLDVSYTAERSVQDEINRQSGADVLTIALSYIIMFVYVTIALGRYRQCSTIPVDMKATVGLTGVFIVLISVGASVGFWSYCGIPLTLIIIEVVPFLVLAVGVDNLFILVQTYQRHEDSFILNNLSYEQQMARVVSKVGPSMLLSSLSESVAFMCGAMTTMPAVRIFSLYASTAVLFDFLLQMTLLIGVMTLDIRRTQSKRYDILCCAILPSDPKTQRSLSNGMDPTLTVSQQPLHSPKDDNSSKTQYSGILHELFDKYYAPFLLSNIVRIVAVVLIILWNAFAFASIHKIPVGLEQKWSMPKDSYMIKYFDALSTYLSVGPPVYYIVKDGHDYTTLRGQNQLCATSGCNPNSLLAQISQASKQSDKTYIATPGASWIDDYFVWLQPAGNPPCCRIYNNTQKFCPSTIGNKTCVKCPTKFIDRRPDPGTFDRFINDFLHDNPGVKCPKGGHAAYGSAVEIKSTNPINIGATYFMTYHTVLKTSDDFTNAIRNGIKLADSINTFLESDAGTRKPSKVIPYSIFYVFYEQYLSIMYEMWYQLAICLGVILIVSFVLLGLDWKATLIIGLNILLIMNSIFGLMYLWGIPFNALSLVNLVMAIGISVEFVSHLVRAFVVDVHASKYERARHSLVEMGSSVLSGITLTKLGGIIVLAFSKSQLFQIFYFRMYLAIVLFGVIHGLIFLPIFLSYLGPSLNKAKLIEQKKLLQQTNDQLSTQHFSS